MPHEGQQEGQEILMLLDYIERAVQKPDQRPKAKLIKVGKAAARIRMLIFRGVKKQIDMEQSGGPKLVVE